MRYVIERQYLLPVFQHLAIAADSVEDACRQAVEHDDWDDAKQDGDSARATTITAIRPVPDDWHGFLPSEIAEGQRRVIVNLDTFEYLDPARFGQMPTLAGMVTLATKDRALPILKKAAPEGRQQIVDVAGALFVMLCHPARSGGGDIPANAAEMGGIDKQRGAHARLFKGVEDVKGRWRGGHILGTGEIRYEGWPTTEEVIERGTDISDKALRYLAAISHF